MLIRYFYNQKFAHASYLIGCQETGEAIVVDPGRDVEPYLSDEIEMGLGLHIVAVAETHIHNDFLSGACELSARIGAKLYLPDKISDHPHYQYLSIYPHELLREGSQFNIGRIKFEVIYTPGHSLEHISLLVTNTSIADQPAGILTGDALIIGGGIRPDFLENISGTPGSLESRSSLIFKTLLRIKEFPDYMQIWPTHGTQSFCDKALGGIPTTTVGYEKRYNWATSHPQEIDFITALINERDESPGYFARIRQMNLEGPPILYETPKIVPLPMSKLESFLAEGVTIIDTRTVQAFGKGYIPGTINIPRGLDLATWIGWLAGYDTPFSLIIQEDYVEEVSKDLIYIGLEQGIRGYFEPSVINHWVANNQPLQNYVTVTPQDIASEVQRGEIFLVDVRPLSMWKTGYIPGAIHIMLGQLRDHIDKLPEDKTVLVYCRSGNKSGIATSLLRKMGFTNVLNLAGGINDWHKAGFPVEYPDPS